MSIAGPVVMTGNTALYQGGVFYNRGNVTLPHDAGISGNSAATCPSVKNWEEWETSSIGSWRIRPEGTFKLDDGSTYSGGSMEVCYFGEDTESSEGTLTLTAEDANCDTLVGAGSALGDYPYVIVDTRYTSMLHLEVGDGDFEISCANQSVSGGGGDLVKPETQ